MRHWLPILVAVTCCGASPARAQAVRSDQLQIVEGVAGIDPDSEYVRIRGEIWNRTGRWIQAPSVLVELFDSAGKPIKVSGFLAVVRSETGADSRDAAVAQRYFVPPGDVAVFEYLRDPAKLGARYAAHKLSAEARSVEGTAPQMAIEGFKTSVDEFGYYTVSGIIKNIGTVGCRSPKAVVAFYNAAGKVQHAMSEEPDETFQKDLAPGGTVRFSRSSIIDGKGAKDVKVWGDCGYPY